MELIHETIDSQRLLGVFDLPAAMRNRMVEVIVRQVDGTGADTLVPAGKSAFGCLRRFANPAKIADEKKAWAKAAVKKHAKN